MKKFLFLLAISAIARKVMASAKNDQSVTPTAKPTESM
jgi:hypothetical protein